MCCSSMLVALMEKSLQAIEHDPSFHKADQNHQPQYAAFEGSDQLFSFEFVNISANDGNVF